MGMRAGVAAVVGVLAVALIAPTAGSTPQFASRSAVLSAAPILLAESASATPYASGPTDPANAGTVDATARRPPTRVVLTPGPSTFTTQRVSWTTRSAAAGQKVQYRIVGTARPATVAAVRRFPTTVKNSGTAAPRYTALMTRLRPGTKYEYRILTKLGNSGWRSFRTGNPAAGVTLIGLGDTQVANRTVPAVTIRAALKRAPGAAAFLHAGDVVNKPTRDSEWADWFAAMGGAGGARNWLLAIGNHEHCILISCKDARGQAFRSYFTQTGNGWKNQGVWYYTDFAGVRVIVLDSFGGRIAEQARFLDAALASNRQQFSIVLMHAPPFAARPKRTNPFLAPLVKVIERRGVDLVLTGHDHSYARGYRTPHGTVFATSNSGPKYYPTSKADWRRNKATRRVRAAETSTFQIITVKGRKLSYTAVVSAKGKKSSTKVPVGGVLDRVDIVKSPSGRKVVRGW